MQRRDGWDGTGTGRMAEKSDNPLGLIPIKPAGGLIGNQKLGISKQRAANGEAPLFAARDATVVSIAHAGMLHLLKPQVAQEATDCALATKLRAVTATRRRC